MDLSPRLVEILSHLAAHPGETISKDTLLDLFWSDVHVTENTLTRAIADIRKALEDDAANPMFIQTMARRGYRFIGRLSDADPFRDWMKGRLVLEMLDATQLAGAVAAFEHVATATPNYAPAHAALANAYFLQFEITRASNTPNRDLLARAVTHARRACDLDASLGEAWGTLSFALTAAGDVEESRAAGRRATLLEPTSWRHHFRLAIACWGEERLSAVDRTLSLMPDFAPARFLAAMVFIARQAFAAAEDVAAKGAASQSRQAGAADSPFPAFGLHWLRGLLYLRAGEIGPAMTSFAREMDEARVTSVYFHEFRVNALLGAGYGHLVVEDASGATEAFRAALEAAPANARALLGLYQALLRTGLAPDAELLLPRLQRSLAELAQGKRLAEAALMSAALHTARGNRDTAVTTLVQLVEQAPAGQTGWMIPIDPALAPLRDHPWFERVLARLAARAS